MAVINKNLKVDATIDNLDRVIGFVEEELKLIECPMKTIMQITVSLEEVYVNVVNYAYEGEIGECEINLSISTDNENTLTLEIKDKGKYFNPLDKEEPDITLSADERSIGGLGIFIMKKSMDEVSYKNISGYNILTIVKKW